MDDSENYSDSRPQRTDANDHVDVSRHQRQQPADDEALSYTDQRELPEFLHSVPGTRDSVLSDRRSSSETAQ